MQKQKKVSVVDLRQAEEVANRLLDSEEHAVEAAIPGVAEEASVVIGRLVTALENAQTALLQAKLRAAKVETFVRMIAGLRVWDHADESGVPSESNECDEPTEGHLDSHQCLMGLIQDARSLQAKSP